MKRTIAILVFTFLFSGIYAQQKEAYISPKGYSHVMSDEEKELSKNFPKDFQETAPPTGDVRNIAEWEQMESVIIAYDYGFGIPYSLIAEICEDSHATILVSGSTEENSVRTLLSNNGVNTDNCSFVYNDPDAWWTRDYSPWCIAVDNQDVSIVDFPYNRPSRVNDDAVPSVIAAELGIDYYGMNVTHTGGNYMTDGYGISVSTDLVYDENSLSSTQIATKMHDYLGISTYHVVADPQGDYIKHVDCWGKFLAVDKIVITEVRESDSRYDDYEATAAYFENHNCAYGYPYQVYRVKAYDNYNLDMNPYTNSLILNEKVFVPITGSSWDDNALAVYEEAMPGYEIIGVMEGSASWYNTDALHCRTHGFADRNMLFIKHYPIYGTFTTTDDFEVTAEVYSYAGNDMATGFPTLNYKINDSTYHSIEMTETSSNHYSATIPWYTGNNTISYYIEAEDITGKTASVPTMKEQDPFVFYTTHEIVNNPFITKEDDVKIYPNPNRGRFYLQLNLEETQNVEINILSINGQIIYSDNVLVNSGSEPVLLNIENISTGVYILNSKTESKTSSTKLIIR
ncbi:MAG: agmatine deiminase family protein [Bacteroidales bacterium]|nr:agmatine deiminase family protein [Bacteroidales bacterium]